MRRFNINDEKNDIKYLKDLIEKFKSQASIFIERLKPKFESHNLIVSETMENSFEFVFWGLNFTTRAEILYDKELKTFKKGELNTYLVIDDSLELIITYNFDYIGNIGDGCLHEDFADFYYVDFIYRLIEFSAEKDLKFKL